MYNSEMARNTLEDEVYSLFGRHVRHDGKKVVIVSQAKNPEDPNVPVSDEAIAIIQRELPMLEGFFDPKVIREVYENLLVNYTHLNLDAWELIRATCELIMIKKYGPQTGEWSETNPFSLINGGADTLKDNMKGLATVPDWQLIFEVPVADTTDGRRVIGYCPATPYAKRMIVAFHEGLHDYLPDETGNLAKTVEGLRAELNLSNS